MAQLVKGLKVIVTSEECGEQLGELTAPIKCKWLWKLSCPIKILKFGTNTWEANRYARCKKSMPGLTTSNIHLMIQKMVTYFSIDASINLMKKDGKKMAGRVFILSSKHIYLFQGFLSHLTIRKLSDDSLLSFEAYKRFSVCTNQFINT